MERLADFRRIFAHVVVARAGTTDARLFEAFASVPRELFVGPAPWYFGEHGIAASSEDSALLYQDVALALLRNAGITTGLPSLHAQCMDECGIQDGEHVTHIGTGAGYFTAVLAEMVGVTGKVTGYELNESLAARAQQNLKPWPQAKILAGSGVLSPLHAADVIYVSAAVQQPPRSWFEALGPYGRLLFPLTPGPGIGAVLLIQRTDHPSTFYARFVCDARFVPCIGTGDLALEERLRHAFASGTHGEVRSLILDPGPADELTWLTGNGWALSKRAVPAA
jgi:protein-L-isoaspartate(D-aspartate) O-methyltransferase